MKPVTARAAPLCQVETCQKPLPSNADRFYLWVWQRIGGDEGEDEHRQIVVCRDCAAMLKKKL